MNALRALWATSVISACTAARAPDASVVEAGGIEVTTGDAGAEPEAGDGAMGTFDATNLRPWPHELPAAERLFRERGMRAIRAELHVHSVHSHDACDGQPYVDGGVNEPCLRDLRAGACRTRLDAIFLTEHAGHLAEGSFERSMQLRDGDEPLREGGALVGYRFACPDGRRVLVLPGAENELMPFALTRHPDAPPGGDTNAAYHQDGPEGAARMRAAGALVAVAHVEQRELAYLRALRPDIVEVYNIHANLDPRIAGPSLGLDVGALVLDVARFGSPGTRLEGDLVFLGFFRESDNDLRKWAALTFEGQRVPGIAAVDAHQNSIPALLSDGERGDSYRRVFRFFSNLLMVPDDATPLTRDRALEALRRGRVSVVFEAWGSPVGFQFVAERSGSVVGEIGDEVTRGEGLTLVATSPTLMREVFDPSLPEPTIHTRILRSDGADWREVAAGDGSRVRFTPTEPGPYRAEVRIVPRHAGAYLPRMERLVREVPWVYASPIYVH